MVVCERPKSLAGPFGELGPHFASRRCVVGKGRQASSFMVGVEDRRET